MPSIIPTIYHLQKITPKCRGMTWPNLSHTCYLPKFRLILTQKSISSHQVDSSFLVPNRIYICLQQQFS